MTRRFKNQIRENIIEEYLFYLKKSIRQGDDEVDYTENLKLDFLPLNPYLGFLESITKKMMMVKEEKTEIELREAEELSINKTKNPEAEILEKLELLQEEGKLSNKVRFIDEDNKIGVISTSKVLGRRRRPKKRSHSAQKTIYLKKSDGIYSTKATSQSVKSKMRRRRYYSGIKSSSHTSSRISHFKSLNQSRVESQRSRISNMIKNSAKKSKKNQDINASFLSDLKEKGGSFISNETTKAPTSFRQPGIEKEFGNVSLFYDDDVFNKRNQNLLDLNKFKRRNRDIFRDLFRGKKFDITEKSGLIDQTNEANEEEEVADQNNESIGEKEEEEVKDETYESIYESEEKVKTEVDIDEIK